MNFAIHGFTGSPGSWDGVLSASHTVDVVGHGGPMSSSFSWEVERLGDAIAARATEANAASGVQLVGYSMGARLALGVACARPDLICGLTLIGLHPGLVDRGARVDRARADDQWCRLLEDKGIDVFVDAWESLPLWASQSAVAAPRLARQRAIRRGHEPAGLAHALRVVGLAAMPNLWPRLASVRVPVHLVCGEHDAKFREIAARAAAVFPRATVEVIPGVGHNPVLEAPQAIAAIVESRSN